MGPGMKKIKKSTGIYVLVGTVVGSNLLLLWYYAFPPEIQGKFPAILRAFLPIVSIFPQELFDTYLREFIEMRLYWVIVILASSLGMMFLNRPARSVFIVFNIIHIVTLTYIMLTHVAHSDILDFFFKWYFNAVAVFSYVGFLTIAEVRNQFKIVSQESVVSLLLKKVNLISRGPNNADAYYNLGLAYTRMERYDDAIDLLKKAIEIKPNESETHFQLGLIYLGQKKYNEAANAFKETVRIDPFHAQGHAHLGLAYQKQGCHQEAIRTLERASHIKYDNPEVFRNLGEAYRETGQPKEALRSLNEAARLDPRDEQVHYQLGLIHFDSEAFPSAREELQKAININPKIVDAHFHFGLVSLKLNHLKDAIRAFKEVIRLDPDHKQAYYQLGFAYTRVPDMISAQRQYQELKALDPDLAENLKMLIAS